MPDVTGAAENDAWWGAGWAIAEDRLFQLELFRRATTGRLAEILGTSYLDDDLIARRDYYTAQERAGMLAATPRRCRRARRPTATASTPTSHTCARIRTRRRASSRRWAFR